MSADQYVFDLQFKGKADGSDFKENQFVIIDSSSMADFSRLKEDLGLCMPEPFTVQYIDDEEDVVSIDTEDEFQEFAKIAKKRASRGMLMRLVLTSTLPLDRGQNASRPDLRAPKQPPTPDQSRYSLTINSSERSEWLLKRLKAELKKEILSELKTGAEAAAGGSERADAAERMTAAGGKDERMEEEVKEDLLKDASYEEEDSDGNMVLVYLPEKNCRKTKLMQYHKRLEKKEKIVEAKIDQRLEKLEMKRKKLMEKYGQHKSLHRRHAEAKVSVPMIMSAVATKESSELAKRVTAGRVFTQTWTIVNDGTATLTNVELRHTWSSPGLEPEVTAVKVATLLPGMRCPLSVRFKAPNWNQHSSAFISYWHFFRFVDARWQDFGHYVSMSGHLKKASVQDSFETPSHETSKKPKHEEKKMVSFMEAVEAATAVAEKKPTEEKVTNNNAEVSNITLKKQMEQLQATLASSQIAAEMAQEAARLLAMAQATEGNTTPTHATPKPSEGDKLNDCGLDEAAAGVQQLNLVDSESDTDANMETNDSPDRGFVMVTFPDHTADKDKRGAKQDEKTASPTEARTKEDKPSQPEPLPFPRLDPNVTYPVFPPPPPRVANPPVFYPTQNTIPHNMFNFPVFPPTQHTTSQGIVFPPPVNYSQIPTYPPMTTFPHPPAVPILNTQPSLVPAHNMHPFNPFTTRQSADKIFWTPVPTQPDTAAANAAANTTEKPAETEAPQEMITTENPAENTSAEEAPQPMQVPQQQHGQQLEQLSQQLRQQQQQLQQQQHSQQPQANPQTEERNQAGDQVQILPQALVDGAINVAATAYSTAWNALNNLRPKEGEASEFDPVFENNMAMLVEMGFNNLERNARLLKRFNNDISQVIGVICSTGGSHNLDID